MSGTDPRLLRLYNSELAYLRRHAAEFADDHQQVAGRLGLDAPTDPDPHVERLLEGVAYLSARVQLKLEDQYPVFTQHLFNALYPHYVRPTPSIAIVAFTPQAGDEKLAEGILHPRGSVVTARANNEAQDTIEFRTGFDVQVWPIEIERVEYLPTRSAAASQCGATDAEAALRIRLKATAEVSFADMPIDDLTFFVGGERDTANRLFEQVMTAARRVMIAPVRQDRTVIDDRRASGPVVAHGLGPDEAILPREERSFDGYRLLSEYFAAPEKFRFFRLTGLGAAIRRECKSVDLIIELGGSVPELSQSVDRSQLRLFTTPVINLFERRFDRIQIDPRQSTYQVLADRARLNAFEVHSIKSVSAYRRGDATPIPVMPLYARRPDLGAKPLYYVTEHKLRKPTEAQQRRYGERDYIGSEVWLSLTAPDDNRLANELEEIALRGLVTNRGLAATLRPGAKEGSFRLADSAGVAGVAVLSGPTRPAPPLGVGDVAWRIVGHLAPGVRGFVEDDGSPETLQEHLSLYLRSSATALRREVQGLVGVSASAVTRRAPNARQLAFVRGQRILLSLGASSFEAKSEYLFSSVVARFLEGAATVNSFAEVAVEVDDGRKWGWAAEPGRRAVI